MSPKVSVLVPTYNPNPSHLKECMESLLGQTFADFELIIVNDGSTSVNVKEIIDLYDDARIRYYENEKNFGISATRNRLIQLAAGEYLAVVDHDDISLPERLQLQAGYLDNNSEIGVVGAFIEEFPKKKIRTRPENNFEIEAYLMYTSAIIHPVTMIRKSILLENDVRYDSNFTPAEDYALWCSLIGKTKFANIPRVLLYYRVHGHNTTIVQSSRMRDSTLRIRREVRRNHPEIFAETRCSDVAVKKKYRLFKTITLLTVEIQENKKSYFLFGKILLLTLTTSVRTLVSREGDFNLF